MVQIIKEGRYVLSTSMSTMKFFISVAAIAPYTRYIWQGTVSYCSEYCFLYRDLYLIQMVVAMLSSGVPPGETELVSTRLAVKAKEE